MVVFWLSYVVFPSSAWKNVGILEEGANILPSTGHSSPQKDQLFRFSSHFSLFNCCLSVVLQLDKGDYPENLQIVLLS